MVTPTYCHQRLVPIPAAATLELEKRVLRETGRKVAEDFIKSPHSATGWAP